MPRTTPKIKFGEPPEKQTHQYDWAAVAAGLRAKPGEWGLIFTQGLTSTANAVRQGLKDLPLDEFEVRTANNTADSPRRCDLWLRYKPKNER